MDYRLFDSYKVASQLPPDIFKQICQEAIKPSISEFQVEGNNPKTMLDIMTEEL